jgi:hypothetical protein
MDTTSIDFVYMESDPRTKQPSACLYLKSAGKADYAGIEARNLISMPCLSFIELDELRYRAKKKFYKAHAASAGA